MAKPFIDVSLLGDKRLQRKLDALPKQAQRKVMRKSLRAGGKLLQSEMSQRAPKDRGRLARTIKVRAGKGRRGDIRIVVRTGTRSELGIAEDARGYYPAAIEYGSARMAAQPFMRPAAKAVRAKVLAKVSEELRAQISLIARA